MQVDLQSLLNEAAGEDPVEQPVETPEEPVPETPEPATEPAAEPAAEPEVPETKPAEPEKKPNPMKEVRDKLNIEQKAREKYVNAIQRYSDGDYDFNIKDFKDDKGKVDLDAFIKAMDDTDTKKKAESKGLTPEVQAEIERIEREKIEIQKAKLQVAMDRAISDLQIDQHLDRVAVNNFFKDALDQHKNPYQWLNQGGSLNDLYYLIYKDRIVQDAINEAVASAKAEWESKNKRVAPVPNPATPTTNNTPDGLSLNDLKDLAAKK